MNHEKQTFPIHPSSESIQQTIDVEVQPLIDQRDNMNAGIGEEGRRKLGDRIMQIAEIVASNPERVVSDSGKSPHERTIHDPVKAKTVALAIKQDMDYIAKYNKRPKLLQRMTKAKYGRALMNKVYWAKHAEGAYDADPNGVSDGAIQTTRLLNKKAAYSGSRRR